MAIPSRGIRSTAGSPSRRTFVRGLAIGSAALSLGFVPRIDGQAPSGESPDELSGNEFDLDIAGMPIDITGRPRTAIAINGRVPGPTLRWREGDTVTIRVRNSTDEVTSLHWHGILLPANMDGVPGLSFAGIAPGETYTYRFKVRQSGTYWYHSHSAFQEQIGLYAPLVIEPREPDPITSDREHVVMLSDWTDEDPERLFGKLKKQSNYYNQHQRTVGDFIRDVRRDGWSETIGIRAQWARMRMSDRDLADVTGATYTFLMNGQPPAANWTGLVQSGERVRLRLINGSSMTHFDVRIPGLKLTVVAADGLPVQPVEVDELRIAVAETYDVIVTPGAAEAYTIFAQALDRTGFAAGTLATRRGLRATVPDVDPRPSLSLTDMGHGHAGSSSAPAQDPHAGHNMGSAAGHTQTHPESERGNPLVDMQTMTAATSLADPGIGLRGNGRRVLNYADLRSPFPDPDGREPSRTIELHLTGHMERFAWSFDGIKFSASDPIELVYGERVRIVLVNDSMMTHPIHLHGMWSDLESEDGRFQVRKHTIDMPPGTRRSYRVTADALGRWAYHCHLLFHMEAGMLREVRVVERPGQ